MIFKDFEYKRIDLVELKNQIDELKSKFDNSTTAEEQIQLFRDLDVISRNLKTMTSLVYVRHSIDTNDKYYSDENDFMDENSPIIESYFNELNKKFANSQFRKELEEEFGKLVFDMIDLELKTFKDEIVPYLQEENKLISEYIKLTSSAKIMFDGAERNLSEMAPFAQANDRNTRKEALKAIAKFFDDNLQDYDRIYDSLVKVRDKTAKILGFENFVKLGYYRMGRLDYDKNDVANYRKQIVEELVPLVEELRKKQEKRIKVDKLRMYDEGLTFLTGNPVPKGNREWQVENAKIMYKELSKETDVFFTELTDKELLDLDSKKGKQGGGYCTDIPNYQVPFIFANFNGTAHDVTVLTHEAGHAFQVYTTMRNVELSSYYWPTSEAAEIHSMSMEFLTWPWMDLFFKEDTEKFKYEHLEGAINFIPYGATVDEFQHYVYENPEVSPEERRKKWLEIESKYLVTRDYDDIEELKKGLIWFRQMHIFEMPFYYIDYTLAQVVALQMWKLYNEDKELAWSKYLRLCQLGGSKTFLELLKDVNLDNPFENGSLKNIKVPVKAYLDSIDDENL